jgi:hypothetical protein
MRQYTLHLPLGFCACFGKRGEEALPIGVVFEDGLAPIATAHEVINRAWILNPQLAGHSEKHVGPTEYVNTRDGLPHSGHFINVSFVLLITRAQADNHSELSG